MDVIRRVDRDLATRLRRVVQLKDAAHYGVDLISVDRLRTAQRATAHLIDIARSPSGPP